MVWHQCMGIETKWKFFPCFRNAVQIGAIILVIEEDLLLSVSPCYDVVNQTGGIYARFTRHIKSKKKQLVEHKVATIGARPLLLQL